MAVSTQILWNSIYEDRPIFSCRKHVFPIRRSSNYCNLAQMSTELFKLLGLERQSVDFDISQLCPWYYVRDLISSGDHSVSCWWYLSSSVYFENFVFQVDCLQITLIAIWTSDQDLEIFILWVRNNRTGWKRDILIQIWIFMDRSQSFKRHKTRQEPILSDHCHTHIVLRKLQVCYLRARQLSYP